RTLLQQKKYKEALEHWLEALNHHRDWPEVHDGLGWTYLNLNRLAESREAFNQAIQHQPLNPLSHKGLNEVKYRLALKSM
ncbi:MAG: tetratricopeptide repeat protein, partial [Nitrospinaceae bacterium]